MEDKDIINLLRSEVKEDWYIAYRLILRKYKTFERANNMNIGIFIRYRWPGCRRHIIINYRPNDNMLGVPCRRAINKNPLKLK